jgi:hypothetical protein
MESSFRIHKTIQYFLQLHGLIPFEDDESNVYPEFSYAHSRRVFACPSTNFGFQIPLKLSPCQPQRTSRQTSQLLTSVGLLASRTCAVLVNFGTSSSVKLNTSLEATYLLLPADTSTLVHSAFTSFTYSPYKCLYCPIVTL